MPTVATSVILKYSHTIGRGEQFGPGFTSPVFVARGEGDMLYVYAGVPNIVRKALGSPC